MAARPHPRSWGHGCDWHRTRRPDLVGHGAYSRGGTEIVDKSARQRPDVAVLVVDGGHADIYGRPICGASFSKATEVTNAKGLPDAANPRSSRVRSGRGRAIARSYMG